MPPDLSAPLKREFAFSIILRDAADIFRSILDLQTTPALEIAVPPGVKSEVSDPQGQFLGHGFTGLYVGVNNIRRVLADVGVTSTTRRGEPLKAYFSGGRSKESKALVAALAIATATLVGSEIEDGSGHWMQSETFSADELMETMMKPTAFDNC